MVGAFADDPELLLLPQAARPRTNPSGRRRRTLVSGPDPRTRPIVPSGLGGVNSRSSRPVTRSG